MASSISEIHNGTYYVEVLGACGNVKSQNVNIDAGSSNILVEKWHDVIFVDNSSHRFIAYQWYRDGSIIRGATEQFYQEKDGLNGCYSVDLVLEVGGSIHSCERCVYKTTKSGTVNVYPNPTDGLLKISDVVQSEIKIYNIVGQLQHIKAVQSATGNQTSEIVIDISHLSAGIYFLRIQTDEGVLVKKVVKE